MFGHLPDAQWLTDVTKAFVNYGPYFIAVLFLVVTITLGVHKQLILRILAVCSFFLSVGTALYGVYIWSKFNPLGGNPDVSYVLAYKVLDNGHFFRSLSNLELPQDLENINAAVYAVPDLNDGNRAEMILISPRPIPDLTLFLKPKGNVSSYVTFCRPPQGFLLLDIVPDESKTDVPQNSRFSFRVTTKDNPNEWKPLTCTNNSEK